MMHKKFKRLLPLLLAVLVLTGCGAGRGKKKSETKDDAAEDASPVSVTLAKDWIAVNDPASISAASMATTSAKSATALYVTGWKKLMDLQIQSEQDRQKLIDGFAEDSEESLLDRKETGIPDEEGIYSAVIKAIDAAGNTAAKEILVIYDATPPQIGTLESESVVVAPGETPVYTVPDGTVTDNYDGVVSADHIRTDLKELSEGANVYTVTVTATDSAGNIATATAGLTAVVDPSKSSTETAGNTEPARQESGNNNAGTAENGQSSDGAPGGQATDNTQPGTAASGQNAKGQTSQNGQNSAAGTSQALLDTVNAYRAGYGLPALTWNSSAASAALQRAGDIVTLNSHQRSDGSWYYDLCDSMGISYSVIGENYARGVGSFDEAMQAWKNSQSDRQNLISRSYTSVGIGNVVSGGKNYYVMLFIG